MKQDYRFSYKVSVRNLDTDVLLIKDAEMNIEGLVEILHRFIDLSDEYYSILYTNMRDFEVDSYSVQGEIGTADPWIVTIVKQPLELPGFWKRLWKIGI